MKGVSVIRDDGIQGKVVDEEASGYLVVEFNDASRMVVAHDVLVPQSENTYGLSINMSNPARIPIDLTTAKEIVLPVIAEEIIVEKQQIERAKVHLHKRIETREELVNTPILQEQVVVERIPVNRLVEEAVPEAREEDGVLIIPLIEEVVVVEKRLFVREEVRVTKQRTTATDSQTVTLRREVVDVERTEPEVDTQRNRE
jgi:uncharacterized protein (TIGR02271 family)